MGKQQVVWGTADGIKLLDIINPTDFRELNQNSMEDSRIPIWMINAEKNIGDNSNLQLIVSQVEENKIPGLNPNDDS
ncbi:MAG: RNA polymerase-associated protein rapA, partial [Candidatus Thiodiazotropha sp.]